MNVIDRLEEYLSIGEERSATFFCRPKGEIIIQLIEGNWDNQSQQRGMTQITVTTEEPLPQALGRILDKVEQ